MRAAGRRARHEEGVDLGPADVDAVGGKNASLGELIHNLTDAGVHVPAIDLSTTNPVGDIDTGGESYEWLATGQGIGYQIVSDVSRARYESVWASVVVVTAASLLLYGIVSVLERLVLRRMGQTV